MSKYKILHLITQLICGGAQDNTLVTIEGLNRDLFEVHLASSPGGEWYDRAEKSADKLFDIPSMRRGIKPITNIKAFFEILKLMKKESYDLIHTHSTIAGLLGRFAGWILGVPVILHTVHGFGFNDKTLSPINKISLIWLEKVAAKFCDCLIMQSDQNLQQALDLGVAPKQKMVKLYSGIQLEPFFESSDIEEIKREIGITNNWPIIGWVGRLSTQNAPVIFLKAIKKVLDQKPNLNIILVGDGELYELCQEIIEKDDPIFMLGYRDDIPRLLSVFEIFVSTVRWAGLGRALTEAMIAGLPVIATEVSGVPEIVHEGETGLLIPPDKIELISEKIIYLLENRDIAGRMGNNARNLVLIEFSAERMVDKTQELYLELIKLKRK